MHETETAVMVGFEGVMGVEVPPPPPPQDVKIAKVSETRIEVMRQTVTGVLESTAFVASDTAGYLAGGNC